MKIAKSRAGYPGVRGQKVQCDPVAVVGFHLVPAGYALHTEIRGRIGIKSGTSGFEGFSPRTSPWVLLEILIDLDFLYMGNLLVVPV
jgi:hypothetical protein